eukprot:6484835-Amphidinium_carterae.1
MRCQGVAKGQRWSSLHLVFSEPDEGHLGHEAFTMPGWFGEHPVLSAVAEQLVCLCHASAELGGKDQRSAIVNGPHSIHLGMGPSGPERLIHKELEISARVCALPTSVVNFEENFDRRSRH